MPQLPSVSELLIGAHNPEVRPESHLAGSYRNSGSAQKKSSETSPRQSEAYLNTSPTIMATGPPAKVARVAQSLHAYPGMVQHAIAESHLGVKDSFVVPSTTSSGRNSISSVGSDSHAPVNFSGAGPYAGGQMDYFNYREGHRPRHASQQSSQSSSPRLHYRQRRESVASAGMITRATSYQSIPSEAASSRFDAHSPSGDSPTSMMSRPRPASFSYAPGPVPLGAPGVFSGPPPSHLAHAYPFPAPVPGPAPGQMQPQSQPQPQPQPQPHVQAQAQSQAHAPLAYYSMATAGSGFPPSFSPGALPGYPGPHNTVIYPQQVQLSPGTAAAYGQDFYQHQGQLKAGPPPPGPYLQMDPNAHHARQMQHHQHHQNSISSEEMVSLATDPNHALINKRCIIKRRTRTGCLTCRKRRIKCDERKPHCFNCERSKKLCLGYEAPMGNNSNNSSRESSREGSRQNSTEKTEAPGAKPEVPLQKRHRSSVHDLM